MSSGSPLYPGTPQTIFQSIKSIERGDSANTSLITVSSHAGTHIDVPLHFCPGGKSVSELLGDCIIISPVYCIDVNVKPKNPVSISDVASVLEKCTDATGILIRTGMFQFRASDAMRYCSDYPWIDSELPSFLKGMCPSLQLFGTDTLSISNPSHRIEGHDCHRAILCGEKPVLIAEDLDLSDPDLISGALRILIYPWIIDHLDGVPALIFAELYRLSPHIQDWEELL